MGKDNIIEKNNPQRSVLVIGSFSHIPSISYRNLFLSQHNFGLNYGKDVEVLHLMILQTIKICVPSLVIVRN